MPFTSPFVTGALIPLSRPSSFCTDKNTNKSHNHSELKVMFNSKNIANPENLDDFWNPKLIQLPSKKEI